jgi:hypothetical protein
VAPVEVPVDVGLEVVVVVGLTEVVVGTEVTDEPVPVDI